MMNKHIAHRFYKVTMLMIDDLKYADIYYAESTIQLAEMIAKDTRQLNADDMHIKKYTIEYATEKEIMLYIIDSLEYREQIEMIEKLYR